ncbi:hypothetical protein pb186bvf_008440 [Paramecium bursaria]
MQQESKLQLRQVFDQFDLDKSGFVDFVELKQISAQMGQEMSDNQIKTLMKTVDENNDGKISFDEFWNWWQFGKDDKFEKLVTQKLKLLGLLKKTYQEFTRFGIPLDQKLDAVYDNHYFAFSLGDFPGHFRIESKLIIKGKGIEQEIRAQNNGDIQIDPSQNLVISLVIQCSEPEKFKTQLETYLKEFLSMEEDEQNDALELEELYEILKEKFFKIIIESGKQNIIIRLSFTEPYIQKLIDKRIVRALIILGDNTELLAELNIKLKSGLQKIMKPDEQFVKALMEGAIVEGRIKSNSSLVKQLFQIVSLMIEEKIKKRGGNKKQKLDDLSDAFAIPMMLKSSKTKFTFRKDQELDQILISLGIDEMVKEQPTARDMLHEEFEKELSDQLKDQKSPLYVLYKIIGLFCQYNTAVGYIYATLPYTLIKIQFNMVGLKDLFDVIFWDDALTKKQEQEKKAQKANEKGKSKK